VGGQLKPWVWQEGIGQDWTNRNTEPGHVTNQDIEWRLLRSEVWKCKSGKREWERERKYI